MIQNKQLLIEFILNSTPPITEEDPYLINDEYWSEYGAVSSGICMCWIWYDRKLEQLSLVELQEMYQKLKK